MFVIVEGIDRVGKSTLCEMLEKNGFITLKDAFGEVKTTNSRQKHLFTPEDNEFPSYSVGKLDTAVQYIKKLHDRGFNIVADRLHLTEVVYGLLDRPTMPALYRIDRIDTMIQEMFGANVMLVYVRPTNVKEASERANRNLARHEEEFEVFFEASNIARKLETTFADLESVANIIIRSSFAYDFYFASPFFRPDQIEREERLKAHLRQLGYRVFSPKEQCNLSPIADPEIQDKVFKGNVTSINNSAAVFAITDTKDMGTIWEAGYAYAVGKPIIYYAETLGDNQFNLMLAKSGRAVCKSQGEVTRKLIDDVVFKGKNMVYEGIIE